MIKCSECKYKVLEKGNGSPSRYYCMHPEAINGIGARMISRCDRHSDELKLKTSPKWCPSKTKCRVCGCTWDNACPGGCYWVESNLCNRCIGVRD